MQHFVTDDQMNIFRMRMSQKLQIAKPSSLFIAVSWQFLVNNQLGGPLDATNLGKYDQLMQACLATGAICAIDIHNFARFNGAIIGQGGPTDAQFADFWSQLASKYASNSKVVFGLMNEPHDLDVPTWANTCQAAVTAIRNAGATSQMILLPGTGFASAGQFISSGSGAALIGVKNPDGTNTGLVLDLHKYLDVDNSGEHATCTTDNIVDAFSPVADFLRQSGRQAIVSETGAGSDASVCMQSSLNFSESNIWNSALQIFAPRTLF
jgi:endoglucanase